MRLSLTIECIINITVDTISNIDEIKTYCHNKTINAAPLIPMLDLFSPTIERISLIYNIDINTSKVIST